MVETVRLSRLGGPEVMEIHDVALPDIIRPSIARTEISQTCALGDIVRLHRDAEGRKHTGSTVILP